MADGSIEIYDFNDGYLRYNLNSQFLNIFGRVYVPVQDDTDSPPSGKFTDERLSLGTPLAFAVWNPQSWPKNGADNWNKLHTYPTITINGSEVSWEFASQYNIIREKYKPLAVGGFYIYYGVM